MRSSNGFRETPRSRSVPVGSTILTARCRAPTVFWIPVRIYGRSWNGGWPKERHLGFFGTAWQVIKSAVDIGRIAESQSELHDEFSALSEKHVALERRVARLESEDIERRDRDAWQDEYELRNIGLEVPVYAPGQWSESDESPHWLCAHCFDNDRKSYLKPAPGQHIIGHARYWSCSREGCRMEFVTSSVPN